MNQTTSNIFLARPSHFKFNPQTSKSNAFQNPVNISAGAVRKQVMAEFECFATKLKQAQVNVFILEDKLEPAKPDAIFPNNWISLHADGSVILYPMYAPNRRCERRWDWVEHLKRHFKIEQILDLSPHEDKQEFLEGTGSMVFDHGHKIAYACLSPRTTKNLFLKVCAYLKYKPIYFHAYSQSGVAVYHTNVMMSIAEKFAIICLESITDLKERQLVYKSLKATDREIIEISFDQMNSFAGNALALKTTTGNPLLVLSQTALDSLNQEQRKNIKNYCEFLPFSIPTIQTIGGGSVRCMIAEIFTAV